MDYHFKLLVLMWDLSASVSYLYYFGTLFLSVWCWIYCTVVSRKNAFIIYQDTAINLLPFSNARKSGLNILVLKAFCTALTASLKHLLPLSVTLCLVFLVNFWELLSIFSISSSLSIVYTHSPFSSSPSSITRQSPSNPPIFLIYMLP